MAAFRNKRSDPHFTVDDKNIYQHIDTAEGARALRNDPGGVQTNRDSAVQIELVGFAHLAKNAKSLTNLARLCRWIETTHGVPLTWPAGPPRPAKNGKDPGGHNRSAQIWDSQGGHYGHCHVPENTHWDPAYTADELSFIMNATFDATGRLLSRERRPAPARARRGRARAAAPASTMPDHGDVPRGIAAYIRDLEFPAAPPLRGRTLRKHTVRRAAPRRRRAMGAPTVSEAIVNVGSLLSFVDGVSEPEKSDVLYSVQLAQRGASGLYDRFVETQSWYKKYTEILENLGWASEQFAFSKFDQSEGEFRMDKAALSIITAIATQNQLAVLTQSISALEKLVEGDGTIQLFDFHSSVEGSGNFQLGAVQRSENGAISMAIGAFYFRTVDERRRFLFFKWGAHEVNFWTSAQRMTLNSGFYAKRRKEVIAKLDADAASYVADLKL